jgi:hypothetical protein
MTPQRGSPDAAGKVVTALAPQAAELTEPKRLLKDLRHAVLS